MYVLCVSGAVNTQGFFVWKFFLCAIYKCSFLPSFLPSFNHPSPWFLLLFVCFSCNNVVVFSGLGRRSPRLPSREGIHFFKRSVLLSLFHGLVRGMIPFITACLFRAELNSSERARERACVRVTITIYFIHPRGKLKLSFDRTTKNISQ